MCCGGIFGSPKPKARVGAFRGTVDWVERRLDFQITFWNKPANGQIAQRSWPRLGSALGRPRVLRYTLVSKPGKDSSRPANPPDYVPRLLAPTAGNRFLAEGSQSHAESPQA